MAGVSMLAVTVELVSALDITWHANPEDELQGDGKDPAKTAPKSQRYWDEHGIVKPDYAYTDDEIRQRQQQQQGQDTTSLSMAETVMVAVASCFVLGMAVALYVLHATRNQQSAHRLGGNSEGEEGGLLSLVSAFVSWLRTALNDPTETGEQSEEKARIARLARFDSAMSSSSSSPRHPRVDKFD
jgi:hypothetical protein